MAISLNDMVFKELSASAVKYLNCFSYYKTISTALLLTRNMPEAVEAGPKKDHLVL
jgi:hypothetical protein